MKGLELAEKYYEVYGKPMLQKEFPAYVDKIAAGLVGQGSECFGYDDAVSQDHDFGPGFCLWLTDEDYSRIGAALQAAYNRLPRVFLGYTRNTTQQGGDRVGPMRISEFYGRFAGNIDSLSKQSYWLVVPEHFLATAVNGKVFCDPLGEFTRIRTFLKNYYPEDIRIKKIAARAACMAQSGQYNYYRVMKRGDWVAARLALDQFLRESMAMIYLLNKIYMPYYKWTFHGLSDLPVLHDLIPLLRQIAELPVTEEKTLGPVIETICANVITELKRQNLTSSSHDFLDSHTGEIMSHIQDPDIRSLHVMTG